MNAREFEGAQKKEPLTVAGIGEGFCQVDKEGEGFQMERVECAFFLLCQDPVHEGRLGVGIVCGPWCRTRVGNLFL